MTNMEMDHKEIYTDLADQLASGDPNIYLLLSSLMLGS